MRSGLLFAVLLAPTCLLAQVQVRIAGYVSDLLSSLPLQYVNIYSNGHVISATDRHGFFAITTTQNDTIVFTRLGYKPYLFVATGHNPDKRVLMSEMSVMLDEVVIHGSYKIHGYDQIRQHIINDAKKGTYNDFSLTPPGGMIQTFGPGASYRIPWDQWTKEGREKKKLQSIRSEFQKTAVYREFIQSIEIEEYMIKSFGLDRDTFIKLKEGFIVAHPDARYIQSRKDLIDLMVTFIATTK